MKRMSPRWCGGLLPGLLLALGAACSSSEQLPAGPDGGTPGPDGGTASRKPYVVFVVDRSATLLLPLDTTNPACRMPDNTLCGAYGQDTCDPTLCPTRLSAMKARLESFLSSHPTQARYGLAFFPAVASNSTVTEACRASSLMRVSPPTGDEPERLQLSADEVVQAIRYLPAPAGGSPLGGTLAMVAGEPPLGSSEAMEGDVVVILTDGPPNCNANNPHDGILDPGACQCTLSSCMSSSVSRLGCLDLDAPMLVLTGLRERGVRTYVIPVGNDALTGNGAWVFHSLAEAGGTLRPCATSAECGSAETCDASTHRCAGPSLQLGELDRILAP